VDAGGVITSTAHLYMDDVMGTSPSLLRARLAMRFALFPLAARLGLSFKTSKTVAPTQCEVEALGIGLDTRSPTSGPTLIVSQERIRATIPLLSRIISRARKGLPIPRRGLASLAGSLCSVAAAVPAGSSFLRRVYDVVHSLHLSPLLRPDPKDYSGTVSPTQGLIADLEWWLAMLSSHRGRTLKRIRDVTLVHAITDASGEGVGATVTSNRSVEAHYLSGVWPSKFKHFSSNWRELRAILLALQRVKMSNPDLLRGAVVYSFTDNTNAAHSINRGSSKSERLMHMIREIKLLEVDLDCTIVSLWMSGDRMIHQGTDGLSRGVLHDHTSGEPCLLPTDASAPVVSNRLLRSLPIIPQYASVLADPSQWYHVSTPPVVPVIVPPPSLMRRAIHQMMEWFRDNPASFEGYIVVPAVYEHSWWRMRRYFSCVHTYQPPPPWPNDCRLCVLCRFPYVHRPNPRYQAVRSAASADYHQVTVSAAIGSNVSDRDATLKHTKRASTCPSAAAIAGRPTTMATTHTRSENMTTSTWPTCAHVVEFDM